MVSLFFFLLYQSEEASVEDLMDLVKQIVAFHMKVRSLSCLLFFIRFVPCNIKGSIYISKITNFHL